MAKAEDIEIAQGMTGYFNAKTVGMCDR